MQKSLRAANTLLWASQPFSLKLVELSGKTVVHNVLQLFYCIHRMNQVSLVNWSPHLCQATFWNSVTPTICRASVGGVTEISVAVKCACGSKSDVTYTSLIICWSGLTQSYLRCGYEGKLSKAQHRKLSSEESELGKHCYYIESNFVPLNFVCHCTVSFALSKAWEGKTNL